MVVLREFLVSTVLDSVNTTSLNSVSLGNFNMNTLNYVCLFICLFVLVYVFFFFFLGGVLLWATLI